MFFSGILELISELAKIVSFSFRLFGNIFAGEVLLSVMTFLIPVIIPLPFVGLEIFVGLIQALVFSLLTLVFINIAMSTHGEEVEHGIN
jgi:F-type H+-transporting ATPase subunit a